MSSSPFKAPFQYEKAVLPKVEKEKRERTKNATHTVKRIMSYLAGEKAKLSLVILMVIMSSGLGLLGPFMVGMAIDDFIVKKELTGLGTVLIWLLVIYLGHSLAIFLQNFWMVGIAQNTVFSLRKDLFNHFHKLPISFFDKRQQGELMSRVTNDIDNINNTLNQSVIQVFASVITLIGTVTVMLILSPILTAITMVIVPLLFFGMQWITRRTGPLYRVNQKDLGVLNGYVEETISGQHIVKTFSQEARVTREFKEKNTQLKHSNFWTQTYTGYIPKLMNMLNFLSFSLIALFGGILAIKGGGIVTVGVIVIFAEYARQFTRPLNELSNQFNILLSAIAGAERVFSIIDEDPEEMDEQNAMELEAANGHFIFDNVSFAYEDTPILKNISFDVKPGQMVAFVGHTGAGKTTIVNLISRFYNYDSGSIRLDNVELNNIKRGNLRAHMAFVLQDTFLFHGTILENIRYGKLHATDEEVINAAKQANAHSFIERMPEGYATILDDSGGSISQGQKQLITIARAMIADPTILILDEATSNIDTITELKIQEALGRLMKGRTSFVIAHRLNTIQQADKIILLENGEIVEEGNHQQLMENKQDYYRLFSGTTDEVE